MPSKQFAVIKHIKSLTSYTEALDNNQPDNCTNCK